MSYPLPRVYTYSERRKYSLLYRVISCVSRIDIFVVSSSLASTLVGGGGGNVPTKRFTLLCAGLVWRYKQQYTNKIILPWENLRIYMRARGASELRKCSPFHTLKLLFLSLCCWYFMILCPYYMTSLSAYMYLQILKCTDKTLKKYEGEGSNCPCPPPPPPSSYASGWYLSHTLALQNKLLFEHW